MKLHLPVSLILQPAFGEAFRALLSEASVPKQNVWWLVRTANRCESAAKVFYKRRQVAVTAIGRPNPNKPGAVLLEGDEPEKVKQVMVDVLNAMPPVETFIDEESPIVLPDPLPASSKLTADHITFLQDCGIVFNPDKNYAIEHPEDTEAAAAPSEAVGDSGSN